MFYQRLLQLESEIIAREESERGISELTPDCLMLLDDIEQEIGARLADKVASDWRGWLTYRRKTGLIVCRGRAFAEGGMRKTFRAGLDFAAGLDSINDYKRGFDVTPAQDLDHLIINFGMGDALKVFLWYGENIAPYQLIYQGELLSDTSLVSEELKSALIEACVWIVKKPKNKTLRQFLKDYEPG
jgi:hypothetical protein